MWPVGACEVQRIGSATTVVEQLSSKVPELEPVGDFQERGLGIGLFVRDEIENRRRRLAILAVTGWLVARDDTQFRSTVGAP